MANETSEFIGRSVLRLEDPPLVTGQGRFANDISFPNQVHMRVVRSPHAHGNILAIDTAAARALRGVVAVWTADDIPEIPPIDFREGRIEPLEPFRQPVLAKGRVRYVGEPVAVVFAESTYVAEDAADLVEIAVEELPVLIHADAPPAEFEPGRSTEATIVRQGYGDVDAAFKTADTVIELDLTVGRHSGVPLETRGAIARYDAARDVLELHGAAKVPHKNREALARMFGRSLAGVHLYESNVGGGFGIRGELYPEDVLVCAAALRLGRPVKWIEDRREHLMAANHSRQQRHKIRAAVDRAGRILAIDDEFFHDQGAYLRTHAIRVPHMICGILPGPYRVPAYRAIGRVRLTNKTPAATYRAPGRYETTFVRERLIDAVSEKLGIDSIEVRKRNAVTAAEMPYARPLEALGEEINYDTGDYAALLDRSLAHVGWDALQADARRRRANGEAVGVGLALFVEKSGLGPRDGVHVTVEPTGAVEVVTGGSNVGQGFDTAIAQICADALGVDYRRVRVVRGRTDRIEYGIGAHASRATVMTGNATHIAAQKVREKALGMAAELLQTPADSLEIADGQVRRKGAASGPSVSLAQIASSLSPTSKLLGNREPCLSALGWFRSDHQVYPYGVHIAVVRVDRETGGVKIERYLAAFDIGRAINPMLVEGQIVGGFAQGMGGALLEEFVYSESGEPLSVTFADYLMPTAHETPMIEVLLREDHPSTRNPLGIKGAGESGITGVGGAIASAIDQAIGIPGAVTQLPVTPQRLREILRQHAAGSKPART
jgi:carbon-monoxide dehydrogenase large subunit/6-hydroxypseudooxynicotine dehydrogenase subunit gamma